MECLHPMLLKPKPWSTPFSVPCGQCIACRLNRSSSWALRIMHEKQMTGDAVFVTLTYDQEHVPWVSDTQATLRKKDLQDFFKRLRKSLKGVKIRYYACGEYGEKYGRPHYHCIIFGLSRMAAEYNIPKVWLFGHTHCGAVTFNSAGYVARYCTKLLTGKGKEWYKERNIEPEFSIMSRKPGIGASWLEKYGNEVKAHHSVVMQGKELAPPRYYKDKLYDQQDKDAVRRAYAHMHVLKKEQEMKDDDHDWKYGTHLGWDRICARERNILNRLKKRC